MAHRVLPTGSMIVGFVGASWSVTPAIAILTSEKLRRMPMFQTMANMALNETMFLLGCGVAGLLNVLGKSHLSPAWCATLQGHNAAQGVGSTAALLVLTIERYIAILHGLRYDTLLTRARIRALMAVSWIVSFTWACILASGIVTAMRQSGGETPVRCLFLEVAPDWVQLMTTGSSLMFCCAIVALNIVISRVAARHQRTIGQQRRNIGMASEDNVRAYRGILKVIVIYMFLQLPVSSVFLLEMIGLPQSDALKNVTMVMIIALFSFDGWFFGFNNRELRERYARIFLCRRRRNAVDASDNRTVQANSIQQRQNTDIEAARTNDRQNKANLSAAETEGQRKVSPEIRDSPSSRPAPQPLAVVSLISDATEQTQPDSTRSPSGSFVAKQAWTE